MTQETSVTQETSITNHRATDTNAPLDDGEPTPIGHQATTWAAHADISARSALVTILGDTIAPLGGVVWLADLIELVAPFGFNDRLVRTSMFRLAAEHWVTNERIGRRSRYSLTSFGREEFVNADARIYRRTTPAWDGLWTLVFLQADSIPDAELVRRLQWRGFAEMTKGVYASPNSDITATRQLLDRLEFDPHPPLATARFEEAGSITQMESFRATSGLATAQDGYRRFIDRYRWTQSKPVDDLGPSDAFLLRTMVIHDLRRARLHDPELPGALLPADWVGDQAMALAGSVYRATTQAAWRWAETATGLTVDPFDPNLALRFTSTT